MLLTKLITNPLWLAVAAGSSCALFFCIGLMVGVNLDGQFIVGEKNVYIRMMRAMESGESQTVGDIIITPAKEWTPERPINYVWPRVKRDLQSTVTYKQKYRK